ncbi:nucleotide pyrophosphohydrolase [Gemella sp. zg-1178]|uniref:nucleotide pyrophosphohydrolase n=1 Tax=Gemella sp. zg-1178 TaxID=2840372 RepID=UPI001C050263|nr:nucleotide pyrophosphohydrolase [Gemella sp. zg-1178]MBU0278592.1 nucleotide pyrophosphohydrolase [Gemella sp. zg-1178]
MEELKKTIVEFREKRGWIESNTEANLARSIIIEAAELLEQFQWQDNNFDKKAVCDELADVLIYSLSMCYHMGVDPKDIITEKLKDVARRYPEKK